MRTQWAAKGLAAIAIAATGLFFVTAPAYASSVTAGDLEERGYKCNRAASGGWLCVKLGDRWLCPNRQVLCIDLPDIARL
ncbi:hypothetical protein [Streptosporangium sp. CA-115845]|uniref:hypothetical protein n=1 Tax=Streptosporangium sp. CA-115845 TaxID=3240071 RepID=UPI003D8F4C21